MKLIKNTWRLIGIALYKTAGRFAAPIAINNSTRTRVVIKKGNKILLVRTWLSGGKWNLVGGGVKKNEDLKGAAIREVEEEVGLKLSKSDLKELGSALHETQVKFVAEFFLVEVNDFKIKKEFPEITDARWFDVGDLPGGLSVDIDPALKLMEVARKD